MGLFQPPAQRARRLAMRLSASAQPASKARPGSSRSMHQRRVVGRDRLALARLAIDLGPHHAARDRRGDQQVVDAHAEVLVEVARAVVPPGVAVGLGVVRRGRRRPGPTRRAWRRPGARAGETCVPPWQAAGSHTSASAGATLKSPPSTSGCVGLARLAQPAGQPLEPGELGLVERRVDDPAVRARRGSPPAPRRRRAEIMRASASGSSSPTSGGARPARSGSPKFVITSSMPHAAGDGHAVPAALAVVGERVAGGREGVGRRVGVGELRLLHQQHVGLGPLQPPRDLLQAGASAS